MKAINHREIVTFLRGEKIELIMRLLFKIKPNSFWNTFLLVITQDEANIQQPNKQIL